MEKAGEYGDGSNNEKSKGKIASSVSQNITGIILSYSSARDLVLKKRKIRGERYFVCLVFVCLFVSDSHQSTTL